MPAKKKVTRRWVKCTKCGFEMESSLLRPQCGNLECRSYEMKEIKKPSTIKIEEKPQRGRPKRPEVIEEKEEKGFKITVGATPVYFDVDELADLQALVRAGKGEDVTDVIKKSIKVMLRQSLGGERMEEDKPEKKLTELAVQDALEAKAAKYKKEAREEERPSKIDELTKTLDEEYSRRMLEARIKRMEQGEANPLEQMITMEMFRDMKSRMGGGGANEELIKRLDNLETMFRKIEEDKKYDELKRLILDVATKSKAGTESELLTKFAEMSSKRDESIEKMRGEIDKARQEVLRTELGAKIERLEGVLAGGKKFDITEVADTIKSVKEIAKELGGKTEKSGAEMAAELIGSTIDKIKEPILEPIGRAAAEKMKGSQQPVAYIEGTQEVGPGLMSSEPAVVPTESEEYSDLVQVSKTEKK